MDVMNTGADLSTSGDLDLEEISSLLRSHGYVRISGLYSDYGASLDDFLERYFSRSDRDINTQRDERHVFSNLHLIREIIRSGEWRALSPLLEMMNSNTMKTVRLAVNKYIGGRSLVSDYLYQVSSAHADGERILHWHADISDLALPPRTRRIKAFMYLNDVDDANGAFSYVPNSHKFSLELRQIAINNGIERLHVIDDFFTVARAVQDELSSPALAFFSSLQERISGKNDPTNEFSLGGKAGTIILFDEIGIHAGGCVLERTRKIFRISFQPEDIYWRRIGAIRSLPRSIFTRLSFTRLHSIF